MYWKEGQSAAGATTFWEDTLRYLYLPRLKDRNVLAQAIYSGAASRDFFGTAYSQHDGKFDGFHLGSGSIQFDDTLLLIEPSASVAYEKTNRPVPSVAPGDPGHVDAAPPNPDPVILLPPGGQPRITSFHGTAEVAPATAKMRMVQLAEEIVSVLVSDPNGSVKVVVEISAEFPDGAKDAVKRAVLENARSLGLKNADWE